MRPRILLLGLCLVGCASKLDFDRVSAGLREDAAVDAGAIDAGLEERTKDASSADTTVELGPLQFACDQVTPAPLFCDDFENEALLDRWGDRTVWPLEPPAGSIDRDSTARRAGKHSLLAVLHAGSGVPCDDCLFAVGLGKNLPDLQLPARLTIEFDLRVDQIASTPQRRVMLMRFILGRDDYGYTWHTLVVGSGDDPTRASAGFTEFDVDGIGPDASVDELPPFVATEHPLHPVLRLRAWSHFKYVLDAAGSSSVVVRLTVDDHELYNTTPSNMPQAHNPRLELGIPDVNFWDLQGDEKTEEWRVRFDNVLVRSERAQ